MLYNRTALKNVIDVSNIIVMSYTVLQSLNNEMPRNETLDFYKLVYVDKGPYKIYVNDAEYNMSEGDCILFMPNVTHTGSNENHGKAIGIISFDSNSDALKDLNSLIINLKPQDKKLFFELLRDGMPLFELAKNGVKLKSGVTDFQIQTIKNRLELLLVSMVSSLKETEKTRSIAFDNSHTQLSHQVYTFLKANISMNLNLNLLSQTFGVSTSYLKTAFKSTYKCGIIDKFIELKIDKAKGYIRDFDYNITEISELLGFTSPQYFCRIFKKRTGMTPSEYAKSIAI